jgi:hypothetical protein
VTHLRDLEVEDLAEVLREIGAHVSVDEARVDGGHFHANLAQFAEHGIGVACNAASTESQNGQKKRKKDTQKKK